MAIHKVRWVGSSGNQSVLMHCCALADCKPGQSNKVIVIEGAPGSGLTSLAQEISCLSNRDVASALEVRLSRADERHLLPEMAKSLGLPCLSSKAYHTSERKAYELAFRLRKITSVIVHDFQDFLAGGNYENNINMRAIVEITRSPWDANVFVCCSPGAARRIREYLTQAKNEFTDMVLKPMTLDENYSIFLSDVSVELLGRDVFKDSCWEAQGIHQDSKGWVGRTVKIIGDRANTNITSALSTDK